MEQILFGLAMAVGVGVVIAYMAVANEDRARHWSRVARELGLQFGEGGLTDGPEMSGTVQGIRVMVKTERSGSDGHSRNVVIRARPSLRMPDELRISREGVGGAIMKMQGDEDISLEDHRHDKALIVGGDHVREVQWLLDHPEARPALDLVVHGRHLVVFEEGSFVHVLTGNSSKSLADHIRDLVEAAQALDHAAAGPWQDAARELGLRYKEPGRTARLKGTLSGLEVRVEAEPTPSTTRFRVRLRGGLPHGVRLRAGKGSIHLGDPILDGRLIIEPVDLAGDAPVPPDAIAWLQARLQDPAHDLRGCLMDVLQGLEGTAVEDGDVTLEHAGRAGPELVDVIRRLTALGVALSDGGETSGGGR